MISNFTRTRLTVFVSILMLSLLLTRCQEKDPSVTPTPPAPDNVLIIEITGDVKSVSIYSPNPSTGLADTLKSVTLPQTLRYVNYTRKIAIRAKKEKVNGTLAVSARLNQKLIKDFSTKAAFGEISFTTDEAYQSPFAFGYEPEEWPCGTHNGNQLRTGERGGCYYINSNGNKTYVDRSECHCD